MNKFLTTTVLTGLSLVMLLGVTPAYAAVGPGGISDEAMVGTSGQVNTGGLWNEMSNGNGPLTIMTGCAPADPAGLFCVPSSAGNSQFVDAPAWTFNCAAQGCWLKVTDAFNRGDQFEVFDNLVSIGTTSAVPIPANSGEQCNGVDPNVQLISDPVVCFNDPLSSSGMFLLGPGAHSITINQIAQDPNVGGIVAYFRVDEHAPVAGESLSIDTAALFVSGVGANAAWLLPFIAGIAGTGLYLAKFRTGKVEE